MKHIIYLVLILELTVAYSKEILPPFFQGIGSPRSAVGLVLLYLFIISTMMYPIYFKILKTKEIKLVALLLGSYLAFLTFRNLSYLSSDIFYIFNLYKRYAFIFALVCVVMLNINSKQKIRNLTIVAVIALTFSSCIGILQYINLDFAWDLGAFFGYPDEAIETQVEGRGRIMGLSSYAIPFSYLLATLIPFDFALIKSERHEVLKLIFINCSIIMVTALLINLTRSAVIGVMLAFLYLFFCGAVEQTNTRVTPYGWSRGSIPDSTALSTIGLQRV